MERRDGDQGLEPCQVQAGLGDGSGFLNVGKRAGRLRAGEKVQDLAMVIWGAIAGVSRKMESQGRL